MLKRKLLLLGGLAAGVTVPIAASKDGLPALKGKVQSAFSRSEDVAASDWESDGDWEAPSHPQAIAPASLAGPKTGQLHTYLDFRITPAWVTAHWTRVSTELAELELEGMRVPVVTGTAIDDLHGSLTYYFNSEHVLERITFYGFTGDPTKLIALVTEYHKFQPARSLAGNCYVKHWNGRPVGVLWVEPVPIVQNNTARTNYRVNLEINSTVGAYKLSGAMADFVKQQGLAKRWSYR